MSASPHKRRRETTGTPPSRAEFFRALARSLHLEIGENTRSNLGPRSSGSSLLPGFSPWPSAIRTLARHRRRRLRASLTAAP